MERIRLSQRIPSYLEACSSPYSGLRQLARLEIEERIGIVTEDVIWSALLENNRYADITNFSSRPVGNEEDVYLRLMALPSEFSSRLLETYRRNGFLTRNDVSVTYRFSTEIPSTQ